MAVSTNPLWSQYCQLSEKCKFQEEKSIYTSSAVLATESKPMYAKKTVADPASIPSTPKGKYLSNEKNESVLNKLPEKVIIWLALQQKHPLPSRKFISSPSSLETKISTSYYDKHHGTYISRCDNGLCNCTLQEQIEY